MEKREITQIKIFKLVLNNMTMDNCENAEIVAIAFSPEKLVEWEQTQIEPWEDGRWKKTYKKDSILEWSNPCGEYDPQINNFGHGIHIEWINDDILVDMMVRYQKMFIEPADL